jgi:hypothetical protein
MIGALMLSDRRRGSAGPRLVGAMLFRAMFLGAVLVACFDDKQIRFEDPPAASRGGAGGTAGGAGAGNAGATATPLLPAGGAASGGAPSGGAAGSLGPVALPAGGVAPLDVDVDVDVDAGAGGAGFDAGS